MKGAPAITITFGEVCENHVGMQKVGALAARGFSKEDLDHAHTFFLDKGCEVELVDLKAPLQDVVPEAFPDIAPAWLLVIRDGLSKFVNKEDLWSELAGLQWDTEARMYGRVVTKHARHNLCFSEAAQAPNYKEGKGTVVAFADVPHLAAVRKGLPQCLGQGADQLLAEGNLYFDSAKCGIGYHGKIPTRAGLSSASCFLHR